jgi:hypothetical protein
MGTSRPWPFEHPINERASPRCWFDGRHACLAARMERRMTRTVAVTDWEFSAAHDRLSLWEFRMATTRG